MAYTIIGQNNSVTTIDDGNGHTLHVPSRVALAIGTTFTITEVNNNMATLEDSNGIVYRDIPCVVNLVDAGGGEPVDYSKTVQKTNTMPTADSSNAGDVYMYTGATDANYTTNYIYENVATTTSSSATASQTTGSSLSDVAVVLATFETQITTSGSYAFTYDGADWSLNSETVDLTDYGITYTGTPVADDVITVVYTESSTTYAWTRIDVQPAPEALPDQTGQSGKFLTTDGTAASWAAVNALQNTATGTGGLGILGTTSANYAVVIGASSQTTAGIQQVVIGSEAKASGNRNVAIGLQASSGGNDSVAVGPNSKTSANSSIALGRGAQATAANAGIINMNGTVAANADANTFKIANANGNFEIMSADGTIPTARFTTDPSADGTYYPTLTISSGTPTRSWSTISALQNINTSSTGIGIGTDLGGSTISMSGSVSIGTNVQATSDCVVIGSAARSFNKPYGVAIGNSSYLGGIKSIAIGYQAKTGADNAIQFGYNAINSDANTVKIANANGNFEIMDANGNLPADRLASTTGLADGNYRLRLTMASGVPTLSWVAE